MAPKERALLMLNGLLKVDLEAVQSLIDYRVPITSGVIDSDVPGIVGVNEVTGATTLGTLGLINGILGDHALIAAVYGDDGELLEFVAVSGDAPFELEDEHEHEAHLRDPKRAFLRDPSAKRTPVRPQMAISCGACSGAGCNEGGTCKVCGGTGIDHV